MAAAHILYRLLAESVIINSFNWQRDEPLNLARECDRQWNVTIGLYKDMVNSNAPYHASRPFFLWK